MIPYTLYNADCLDVLPTLEAGSVDAVICDPPYAEIDRPYGRLTEVEWFDLMRPMVLETRRILKPHGSAVFILQPNSERVGSMRGWVWRFLVWCVEEWNIVQDVYWWNITAMPSVHTHRDHGLMRNAVKMCVWIGAADCYRNQGAVLWRESDRTKENLLRGRALQYGPSGYSVRHERIAKASRERGGVTPFNVLPFVNTQGRDGHGAATPDELVDWWLRYITKPGDTVADWCMGSGTTGHACGNLDRRFIGIEKDAGYFKIAQERIATAYEPLRMMQVAG